MKKTTISTALRRMAEYLKEDTTPTDCVFLTIMNDDGSVRLIPYDCDERTFENSSKTVYYLGNGILRDAELIGLASELWYGKEQDNEYFDHLYEILEQVEYDNLEALNKTLEEVSQVKDGGSVEVDDIETPEHLIQ